MKGLLFSIEGHEGSTVFCIYTQPSALYLDCESVRDLIGKHPENEKSCCLEEQISSGELLLREGRLFLLYK